MKQEGFKYLIDQLVYVSIDCLDMETIQTAFNNEELTEEQSKKFIHTLFNLVILHLSEFKFTIQPKSKIISSDLINDGFKISFINSFLIT